MRLRSRSGRRSRCERELEALSAAAKAATGATDLSSALQQILDAAIGLAGADEGSIQLLDPVTMSLQIAASRGLPESAMRPVGLGQGVSGIVAVTGQPLLLSSPIDVRRYAGFVPKEREIHAALCVPLRAREEIIGVLSVNTRRPGSPLSERDRTLMAMFADHAAVAIVDARHLADAQQHAVEIEMLRGVAARLTSSLDPEKVSHALVEEATTALGASVGFLLSLPTSGWPAIAVTRGVDPAVLDACDPRMVRWAPRELRVIGRCSDDPMLAPLAPVVGDGRLALLPVQTGEGEPDALLGIVIPAEPPPAWRRLLWTLASQAGIALTNALRHGAASARERTLDAIVTTLPHPVLLLDDDMRIASVNAAAVSAFGLSARLDVGRDAASRLPPAIVTIACAPGGHAAGDAVVEDERGRRTFRVTAMASAAGDAGGYRVVLCEDVTAERDVERRKRGVLSVIGHELRTPLTVIGGFAWTLLNRGEELEPAERSQALMAITANSTRLHALMEDLLAVSEVDDAPLALRIEEVDLAAIVDAVVARVGDRRPAIEIDRTPGATLVRTDRIKVEQALWRVLDNAVKHGGPGCRIGIRVEPGETSVSVTVHDDGPGIPASLRTHVFDPFFQLDPTDTRRVGGAGCGLAIARSLMSAVGGGISIDDAAGGAAFTLRIPRTTVLPSVSIGRAQAWS